MGQKSCGFQHDVGTTMHEGGECIELAEPKPMLDSNVFIISKASLVIDGAERYLMENTLNGETIAAYLV